MSRWGQPAERIRLRGKRARLRILDPRAAFELEPELIERLGDPLLGAIADPAAVARSLGRPQGGPGDRLRVAAEFAAVVLRGLALDPAWLTRTFEICVFDRLELEGVEVADWIDWSGLRLGWHGRWHVLGLQLAQTFGPLWRRSPYQTGGRGPGDYGVPKTSAPPAVEWSATIAKLGMASSANEVLYSWTPERVIDIVETASRDAEIERRHQAAADARARC